ncbi:MAG: hypothetical protein KF795_05495, partial [Labilithrix sp.]|nr:hypothetical protein [Labilithrix sp.]
ARAPVAEPKAAAEPKATAEPKAAAEPKPAARAGRTKGGAPGSAGAASNSDEVDEETRKAIDALQKSQLESSF